MCIQQVVPDELRETMIAALLFLVFAVLLLGWLMAAVAYVAIIVSMLSRVLDPSSTSPEDGVSAQSRSRATDAQFLRDVGIQP